LIAGAFGPELAQAAIPIATVDVTARTATQFATGGPGSAPAPISAAVSLAERVVKAMFWIKRMGVAAAAIGLVALGIGAGVGAGFASSPGVRVQDGTSQRGKLNTPMTDKQLSPAEKYRPLLKRYAGALKS
jgi:hypothetical protein